MGKTFRRKNISDVYAEVWDHIDLSRDKKYRKTNGPESGVKHKQNMLRRAEDRNIKYKSMMGDEVFHDDRYSKTKSNAGYQYS